MPYSASQFKIFMENTGLLNQYPKLCFKLTHGFPLGNLTPVLKSYCPPNLPSADFHSDIIWEYITHKLRLGCFTGTYTNEELKHLMGPFCSSPFQVTMKVGACGQPNKYQVCHHLSFKGMLSWSINDDIDPKEYPTRWGKATDMAKIVCLCLFSHLHLSPPLTKILILELYSKIFSPLQGISLWDASLLIQWMSLLPGGWSTQFKTQKMQVFWQS